jgi:hypothetical protein
VSLTRKRLRELLENDFEAFEAIWKEVTTKRFQKIYVDEHQIKMNEKGTRVIERRTRKVPYDVEVYPLKDAITFARLLADFGVGKPPEEKTVNVNVTARRIEDATDDELTAIAEGRAGELPPGS